MDKIEKTIVLAAPRARVWRALTDSREFSQWFRIAFDAPFEVGKTMHGRVTYPGFEDRRAEIVIERMDAERLFSYRWRPAAIDPKVDYSKEPMTLVEFRLEDAPGGTRLTIVESGFDRVPEWRRADAFRMNDDGWSQQMQNIERHVTA